MADLTLLHESNDISSMATPNSSPEPTELDLRSASPTIRFKVIDHLAQGLPGMAGNHILLLKTGIPTPSAGLVLPEETRQWMTVYPYFDIGKPPRNYVRHVPPSRLDSLHEFEIRGLPQPQQDRLWRMLRLKEG
ncbi:hypothetical protein [Salinibacter sp.]|uniref:hypothetical protein n=1 Tax=Salinibacter sp. TaxID=2065818 RepID=UPI0021E89365|nr:hypothetical protein [Salinibacter sp.]